MTALLSKSTELHPVLKGALMSLDLSLEAELARYEAVNFSGQATLTEQVGRAESLQKRVSAEETSSTLGETRLRQSMNGAAKLLNSDSGGTERGRQSGYALAVRSAPGQNQGYLASSRQLLQGLGERPMALPRVSPWYQQLRSPLSLGAFAIIASTTALLGWTHLRSTATRLTATEMTKTQDPSSLNSTASETAAPTPSDLASEPSLALPPSTLNATNQPHSQTPTKATESSIPITASETAITSADEAVPAQRSLWQMISNVMTTLLPSIDQSPAHLETPDQRSSQREAKDDTAKITSTNTTTQSPPKLQNSSLKDSANLATVDPTPITDNSAPPLTISDDAPAIKPPNESDNLRVEVSPTPINSKLIYVLVPHQGEDSLAKARQVVKDAYLVNFPVGIHIQMGAFHQQTDAERLIQLLQQQGIQASSYPKT